MKPGNAIPVTITLDGKNPGESAGKDAPEGKLNVHTHTLYELIDLQQPGEGQIDIKASMPGLEAYAFTFGG